MAPVEQDELDGTSNGAILREILSRIRSLERRAWNGECRRCGEGQDHINPSNIPCAIEALTSVNEAQVETGDSVPVASIKTELDEFKTEEVTVENEGPQLGIDSWAVLVDTRECMPSNSTADTAPPPEPTLDPATSGSLKDSNNCMICATKIPASKRGCCNMLQEGKQTTNASHKPLLIRLGNILGVPLSPTEARSYMVCQKCLKLLNDVDTVEVTLENMKDDIRRKYNRSVEFWEKLESGQPDSDEQIKEKLPKRKVCRRAQNQPEVETGACEGCTDGQLAETDFEFDEDEEDDSSGADPLDQMSTHVDKRPFQCDSCGKTFTRKVNYVIHLRTHTGERPFQCELCGVRFSQQSNLRSHTRATHLHDRRYRCEACDVGFKRRRLLAYHNNRVHTGERPYKCEQCNNSFIYQTNYKKHLKSHTGEKLHKCEICGKAFNSRDNRNTHLFTHSDKKRYECKVCGRGYMRKSPLYTHMKGEGHFQDIITVNHLLIHHVDGAEVELRVKPCDAKVGQESTIEGMAVAEDDPGDPASVVIVDGLQLEAMEEAGDGVPMDGVAAGPEVVMKKGGGSVKTSE